MITLLNWSTYQHLENGAQHTGQHTGIEDATDGTTHDTTLSKEVKNLNKKYKSKSNSGELDLQAVATPSKPRNATSKKEVDPAIRAWFDNDFWPLYPRHEGRSKAMESAGAKATTPEKRSFYLERLKAQLPEYERRKQESSQRVIPMGSTWFNQDRAEDDLSAPQAKSCRTQRAASAGADYPEYVPLARSAFAKSEQEPSQPARTDAFAEKLKNETEKRIEILGWQRGEGSSV
jgi:hypothetical protein